jgi:hypothetical protein
MKSTAPGYMSTGEIHGASGKSSGNAVTGQSGGCKPKPQKIPPQLDAVKPIRKANATSRLFIVEGTPSSEELGCAPISQGVPDYLATQGPHRDRTRPTAKFP